MTRSTVRQISLAERLTSAAILLVLAAIALVIVHIQSHPTLDKQGLVASTTGTKVIAVATAPLNINAAVPEGYRLDTPATYDVETLYEKINGKAPLYLDAGFKTVFTQRIVSTTDDTLWAELFIYDMAQADNAFAVFSAQRRPNAAPISFADNGYSTANAAYLAKGPYYIEIIGSSGDDTLHRTVLSVAEALSQQIVSTAKSFSPSDLFNPNGLIENSINLLKVNAFGFEYLENVYMAGYNIDGQRHTLFIMELPDAAGAAAVVRRYVRDLSSFGYSVRQTDRSLNVLCISDICELVTSARRFVIGSHDSSNVPQATALIESIIDTIEAMDQ